MPLTLGMPIAWLRFRDKHVVIPQITTVQNVLGSQQGPHGTWLRFRNKYVVILKLRLSKVF